VLLKRVVFDAARAAPVDNFVEIVHEMMNSIAKTQKY
jgi:hypothetical protein